MNGEIFFDMTREDHPVINESKYLLKRWTKYSIYSKSGSYNRTDNPSQNLYMTNSIYLYDYVVVSQDWFNSMVHTVQEESNVPGYPGNHTRGATWTHFPNTFKQSPNMVTNNYMLTGSYVDTVVDNYNTYVKIDNESYFELVNGYPRNHFVYKRSLFSLFRERKLDLENKILTVDYYDRNKQSINSTVGIDGLEDGSLPVQTTQVGNLNLVQTDNVINH